MTAWASGVVEVSNGVLAYHRTGGTGPSLVLSHGLTDNGLCWRRFAAALESEFDIVMLDARGHGASSPPPPGETYSPGQDIAEAIERLGLRTPIVMGHSVGARATADFAAAFPQAASRVILEDPAFLPVVDLSEIEARRARFRRQVERFRSQSEAQIMAAGKLSSPSWHADDFPDWAAAKRQVDVEALPPQGPPWQTAMSRIAAPTLVIHGEPERGSLVTAAVGREIRALKPDVALVEIAGAGHNTRRENFADYLQAARAFLART